MTIDYKGKINTLFNERCFSLLPASILKMNDALNNGDLNNVIVGLSKQYFGILVDNDLQSKNYQLIYINGSRKIEGSHIKLNIDDEERDELTFCFARYLAVHYPYLDVIDTFNRYQFQTQSFIEKLGYITIESNILNKLDNPEFVLIGKKGIYNVTKLDKISFYKSYFENNEPIHETAADKYVYLLLNPRTNFFKIGSSKKVGYREKTLQSQEPEIKLITYWPGSVTIEKELHKKFQEKRQRGEWFKLDFDDLETLNNYMLNSLK